MAQKNKKRKQARMSHEVRQLCASIKRLDKAVGHLIDAEGDCYWWSPEARTTGAIAVDLACKTLSLLQKQLNEEFGSTE